MPKYACMLAAIASASWASRSACSGSPCAIADAGARGQRHHRHPPVVVETASSAERRAAT